MAYGTGVFVPAFAGLAVATATAWWRVRSFRQMTTIGSPARTMAINGAMLYGAGAALIIVFLVAPHPTPRSMGGVLVGGAIASVVTVLLLIGRDWLPARVFPALTAAGTAIISLLIYSDGAQPSAFSLLYVWAAVYAFYFYPLTIAWLEAAWIAIAAAAALGLTTSGPFPFFRWIMVVATSVMAGLAVRQLVVQVQSLADRDALTGVFSRRKYHEEVEREIHRARRSGRPLGLVLMDLDNFKELNDSGGHLRGDRHLYEAAQAWQQQLRATDLIARFGGEEFVVVLPDTDFEHARLTADRLRAAVPAGETASAGVAVWDGQESAADLLGRADTAMYSAKAQGRNATVVAGPGGRPGLVAHELGN
jgi:diguanylate cyclase (GGDEF)-like protein